MNTPTHRQDVLRLKRACCLPYVKNARRALCAQKPTNCTREQGLKRDHRHGGRREERHALGAEPCVSISYARAGNGDGDSPTSAQPNRPRRTSKPSPLWGISRAAPREKELSVRGVMCARTVHATHASHVLVVVVVSSPSSCSSSSSSRLSLSSFSLSLSSRRYDTLTGRPW